MWKKWPMTKMTSHTHMEEWWGYYNIWGTSNLWHCFASIRKIEISAISVKNPESTEIAIYLKLLSYIFPEQFWVTLLWYFIAETNASMYNRLERKLTMENILLRLVFYWHYIVIAAINIERGNKTKKPI